MPAPPHEVATPPQAESPAQPLVAAPRPLPPPPRMKHLAKFAVTGTLPQLKALKAFMEKEGMQYDTIFNSAPQKQKFSVAINSK